MKSHAVDECVVRALVVPRNRARYLDFLRTPKTRRKFLFELLGAPFDARRMRDIPADGEHASSIEATLRRLGAPDECSVISFSEELDGMPGTLSEVLRRVVAKAPGTIVSCIHGQLAFHEGEGLHNRRILVRER